MGKQAALTIHMEMIEAGGEGEPGRAGRPRV